MAVTRQSFARSVLSALNAPVTEQNLKILIGWQSAEGGAGPQFGVANNTANYNPLNTTQPEPGSVSVNSVGVQSYKSWAQGLDATVVTLNNGHYGAILRMLSTGNASAEQAVTAITVPPTWGTSAESFPPSLVTSAPYETNNGGDPIQTVVGGGVFGMGGTGNTANVKLDSLWTVGDASNPDQDYWTTINQYCQDAQWFVWSDGETLFVADGYQIMGQQPQAVLALTDPRVVTANCTYDNTAFQRTTTHIKKGNIVRRAALASVQSPTEITITLICDIDRFRAGDTVYLKLFGPADGIWLISDCTRSIFSPTSQLTLSQAMQPVNALTGLEVGPAFETGPAASKPGSGRVIAAMISEATTIANQKLPYEFGGGHAACGTPSPATQPDSGNEGPAGTAGFDCSAAVCAVLAAGGLWKEGAPVPGDADVISELRAKGLILPGAGASGNPPECTLFDQPGHHIYMRLNGQYWGTWAGGSDTPGGGGWCASGFPMPGFIPYHVPQSILGQMPASVSGVGD